jgi:hypothetical protein
VLPLSFEEAIDRDEAKSQTADQVNVARSNIDLAEKTLTQSGDRFSAGVTDTVEVVQSQEAVASAHEQYISSLYSYNYAKISLVRALGIAEPGLYADGAPQSQTPQKRRDPGHHCGSRYGGSVVALLEQLRIDRRRAGRCSPLSRQRTVSGYVVRVNVGDNQWVEKGNVLVG